MISQGVVAGSSLLLQIFASRRLGSAGLGRFSLLIGILITLNSVQSGWIGDSLTVLDRFHPGIRRALVLYQYGAVVLVAVIGTAVAVLIDGVGWETSALFGAACALWAVEETGRRLLIARRDFWPLAVNDLAYGVGAFVYLGAVVGAGHRLTLTHLTISLGTGAATAIVLALFQLPRSEFARPHPGPAEMRKVAGFAAWRAAQVGLRPASLAVARAIVSVTTSVGALGRLEGARLVVAPVLTVANGAGVYLLPTYTEAIRNGRPLRPRVGVAMAALGAACLGYGLFAVAFSDRVTDLLTAGNYEISRLGILGWAIFSAGFAMGIPVGNAVVAYGESRRAFMARAVDAIIGTAAAGVFAVAVWINLVPIGLAIGTAVGMVLLLRRLKLAPTYRGSMNGVGSPGSAPSGPVRRVGTADVGTADVGTAGVGTVGVATAGGGTFGVAAASPPLRGRLPRNGHASHVAAPVRPAVTPGVASSARLVTRLGATASATFGMPNTESRAGRAIRRVRYPPVWWIPLLLIVATEYKFRRRTNEDSLSGSLDIWTAVELAVYAVVGFYLLLRWKPHLRPNTLVVWLVGYCVSTAVSALYAPFPVLAMARAVQLVIILLAIIQWIDIAKVDMVRRFLHAYIILITASIFAGIAYVAPTTVRQEGRFTWFSTHSVVAGLMLAISCTILFGMWLTHRVADLPWQRWVYGLVLLFHLFALVRTRTRGSIGAAAVAILLMTLIWLDSRGRRDLAIIGAVTTAFIGLSVWRPLLLYLTRGEDAAKLESFNRRTEIWTLALETFLNRPLHGLGFTSARGVFFDQTGLGGAHNAFVNVVVDVGLVGLFWWFGLIGLIFVAARRARRSIRRTSGPLQFDVLTIVGVMACQIVNGITAESLGAGVTVGGIFLYVTAGWVILVSDEVKEKESAQGPTPSSITEQPSPPPAEFSPNGSHPRRALAPGTNAFPRSPH